MIKYISGLSLFLFVSTTSLIAQENTSFEVYKKAEKAKFKSYKEKQEQLFEDFKKEELAWNKAILGYFIDTPVSSKVEVNSKIDPLKLPTPIYVDLKSKLKHEMVKLKEVIHNDVSISAGTEELVDDKSSKLILASIPHAKPIHDHYRLSSAFGYRFHPTLFRWRMHGGIDMACPKGTPVYLPINGTVLKSGWINGYGNYIKIQHSKGFETVYAHLSKINVKNGQKVEKGSVIGQVGSTGRSTGPHLHYEVLKNHKRLNPEDFFL